MSEVNTLNFDSINDKLRLPEQYKDSFSKFEDKWASKQPISEVWEDIETVFFPVYSDSPLFSETKLLLSDDNAYIKALSDIKNPFLVYMQLHFDGHTWDKLLEFLEKAPCCIISWGTVFDWNGTVVAPVILYLLIQKLQPVKPSKIGSSLSEDELEKLEKILDKIASILKSRCDGFYLAYYYVEYLMKKILSMESSRVNEFEDTICSVFFERFQSNAKLLFSKELCLDASSLTASKEEVRNNFVNFGLLSEAKEGQDILISFITRLNFLQDADRFSPERCLQDFTYVAATEAWSFYTYDFNVRPKHIEIANLILNQKDIVSAWKDIYDIFSMARNRLASCYYGDLAMNLQYRFNFMRNVGLRMLDILISEERTSHGKVLQKQILSLWYELWKEAVNYMRRFAIFHDDFSEKYICLLVSYRWVIAKNLGEESNAGHILMHLMHEIDNFPHTIVMALKFLEENNYHFSSFLTVLEIEENLQLFFKVFALVQDELKNNTHERILLQYIEKCQKNIKTILSNEFDRKSENSTQVLLFQNS